MKIQNVTDIDGFFQVVDHCKGKVELVTNEGDRLNLKSKLSQYISLAKVFSDDAIPEMELVVYDPDDTMKFINFMTNGATN
ncbi:MAG: polya polymerase [Lachnospiraceae bacterium]|nr:polya polymerase [Lachnospiraceae bacterium]